MFDPKLERFTWSDKILELKELNSNSADPWVALKAQLDGLEESQRLVLTTVALLGNTTFDIGIVERVLVPNEESDEGDNHEHCLTTLLPLPEHKQREELEKILLQLSEQGLVKQPSDSSNHYGMHDLVLEVAREHLLPDAQQKKALHLILGRRLCALMECSKETGMFLEETLLFNFVNQMNLASSLIQDRWELVDLVNKNYDASEVAALKYSYFSGLKYSFKGMELLRFAWNEQDYGLMLKLSNAQSRMHLYCGQIAESIRMADQIITRGKTFHDKRFAYRTKLMCLKTARQDNKAACDFILQILDELGQSFPKRGLKAQVSRSNSVLRRMLKSRSLEDMTRQTPDNLLEEDDENNEFEQWNEIGDFMVALCDLDDKHNHLVELSMVRLLQHSMDHGRVPATALSFVYWGYILMQRGEHNEAIRFGKVGLQYANEQGLKSARLDLRAKMLFHKCIDPWSQSTQDTL